MVRTTGGHREEETQKKVMYNMSPFKKEPDPKDDPAYMWVLIKVRCFLTSYLV